MYSMKDQGTDDTLSILKMLLTGLVVKSAKLCLVLQGSTRLLLDTALLCSASCLVADSISSAVLACCLGFTFDLFLEKSVQLCSCVLFLFFHFAQLLSVVKVAVSELLIAFTGLFG